jgi:hypothetical protein
MVKEPAGTRIITAPAELLNSEISEFDMTIQFRLILTPALDAERVEPG